MATAQVQTDSQVQPGVKPPAKRRKLVWILICVASIVAGAAVPVGLGLAGHNILGGHAAKKTGEEEKVSVVFGEAAVNLSETRMTRYLRVKIVLLVDAADVKDFTKRLESRKPVMKDWLIGHLSGKSLRDVNGTVNVKRIQREIQERFEELLYGDGDAKPFEVLFEEFVVQ